MLLHCAPSCCCAGIGNICIAQPRELSSACPLAVITEELLGFHGNVQADVPAPALEGRGSGRLPLAFGSPYGLGCSKGKDGDTWET